MRWNKISDAVIRRLPLYLRVLDDLANETDVSLISSQELGVKAGVGPALVRKDLAWFGGVRQAGRGLRGWFSPQRAEEDPQFGTGNGRGPGRGG